MGSGCSRMHKSRRSIQHNGTNLKAKESGNDGSTKESQGTEGLEEEDDLDVLSPISAITKVGSARTRGMSAASTVLPGTSISLSPAMEDVSDLHSYQPLPELVKFSDDSRDLLLGRCSTQLLNESRQLNEIPLLVLCNGHDAFGFFQEVQKKVLGHLKQMCFLKNTTLNVFIFGHQSIPCGSEFRHLIVHFTRHLLKSSSLLTVTIFGRPSIKVQPPNLIFQSDFDLTVGRMSSAESRELIHYAYAADVNALKPCYRLSARVLKHEDWPKMKDKVLKVLESSMEESDKDVYLTTVFEDLLRILLDSSEKRTRQRSFLIHLEHSTHMEDVYLEKADVRVHHMLSTWEDIIPDDFKYSFFDGDSWQELEESHGGKAFDGLQARLQSVLEDMLQENPENTCYKDIDIQLREELIHQQNEIQNHLKVFQDRPELLSSLMNYVAGPQSHPLIVHGRQGRGKSALLAVATVLCGAVFPSMPVILRSACVSPESFTQEQILRSVCEQLSVLYGGHPSNASRGIAEHNHYFSSMLKRARAERPLLIMLDGLDQVEEYSGRSLKWFPAVLPQHVKLILGLRDGTGELEELQERLLGDKSAFLEVPDMDIEETLSVIKTQMRERARRLTDNQIHIVRICVTDNSYPRYAHTFAQVACTWNSLCIPEHFWARHSLSDIFNDYLTRMSSTVSLRFIKYFLAILLTPKHGLMQFEILELLRGVENEMNGLTGDPILSVYLHQHLSCILRICYRKNHTFVLIKSQLFRKLCKNLVGSRILNECLNDLLKYFQNDSFDVVNCRTTTDIKTNYKHQRWRSLEETTHLRIKLNLPVRKNFFDHIWLSERVCSGDPYLMLEEIKMYKRKNPDDREFDVLRKFLQVSSYALRHDGKQLFTQLYGRIRGYYVEPENSIKYPNMKNLYKTSATPPVPSFLSQGPCLRTLVELQKPFPTSSNNSEYFDDIIWLDTDGRYLVTFSSSKSEVSAWNVIQMKKITSMWDMVSIDGMVSMHNNAEVLLLHHNRIELYDLAKGILKVQMVELIDVSQGAKVIAGGKNVIAVSAGHDEILRFETYSGHVVSRIATGGKRRLDHLVVSNNEEICACGDSIQKPYPILVWSLKTGENLHELSMAHHEFLMWYTKLGADGSMLFTVAKELLDTSPNFLLAYDLITGSIAWEIHLKSNITAMDVSFTTDTLMAATDHGEIYSWSMMDGIEKFKKPIQPQQTIDRLKGTSEQSFFTWDSRTKDRTLRLWNAINGTIIATFTADYDILHCTISQEGNSIGLVLSGKESPAAIRLRSPMLLKMSEENDS